jgi:integrase
MPKITKTVLAQLAPRQGAYVAWDSDLPNFGVRVYPSGQTSYVIGYRTVPGRRGVKKTYVLGTCTLYTPEQARDLARQYLAQIRHGADPVQAKADRRQAPTVADLAERYLSEHAEPKKKPSSVRMDRTNLRLHVLPALGSRLVTEVTRADIAHLHHGMRATPGAANRVLALLSTMFGLAETWEWCPLHSNPTARLQRYKERKMERFLTADELGRLGTVLKEAEEAQTEMPSVLACIRLLIFTGARLSEVLGLRWTQIDWGRGLALLPDSKTGEKPLRLPPPALGVLRRLAQVPGHPYCLPGRRHGRPLSNPHRPWYRLCAAAGLEGVRLYDLRHTYATTAGELGYSLPMIGALLGHSHQATTARYTHLVHDPVTQAAERVGETLERALGD